MKRALLLSALLPLAALSARAQFQYTFSSQTGQPYTALPATASSVNGTLAWDEQDFRVPLPFTLRLNGTKNLNTLGLLLSPFPACADDTGFAPHSGFVAVGADLWDKALATTGTPGASQSPIRYQTTGTTPNRIFKLEIRNAGFYDEYDYVKTANDSVSFQYWFYEDSSTVEFHYGPSHIASNLFFFGSTPSVGFFQDFDRGTGALTKAYFLTGPASAPMLDSTAQVSSVGSLNGYPASGTVYRFKPKAGATPPPPPNAVGNTAGLAGVTIYPTAASGFVSIGNPTGQPLRYSLLTLTGSVVTAAALAPGTQAVDVSALPAGTYVLRIEGAGTRAAFRFTKL